MSTAEQTVQPLDTAVAGDAPRARAGRRARLSRPATAAGADLVAILAAHATGLAVTAPLIEGQRADVVPIVLGVGGLSVLWMILFAAYGLHRGVQVRISDVSFAGGVKDVFHPLALGGLALLLAHGLTGAGLAGLLEPVTVALTLSGMLVLVPLARVFLRSPALSGVSRPERAVIVGSGVVARLVARKLAAHPRYGIDLVGFLDDDPDVMVAGCERLGSRKDLAAVCRAHGVERVLLAYSRAGHEEMLDLVRSVRSPGIQVSIVPRFFEIFPAHASLDDMEGVPVITLPQVRLGRGARALKRSFDVVVSGGLVLLLSPLLLAIAARIRVDSPGPALFRQARRGRDGRIFMIRKFRTMHVGAESQRQDLAPLNDVDGPLFKLKTEDPRTTRFGRFLRRTSLDELPQLINVLRGEMSLVGPRPFVIHESDQITGWATRRLEMTPGITGLWQALGRNDLSYDEMKKLDYLYVTSWSLWWDIKILARTARVVLRRHGAY